MTIYISALLRPSYDAKDKRGYKRQALRVATCFPVLLGWVVSWWHIPKGWTVIVLAWEEEEAPALPRAA